MFHTATLRSRCVYGVGYEQFASLQEATVEAANLPWTCPENQSFPWIDLGQLYIEDGDVEHTDLSSANLVCEGTIIDVVSVRTQTGAVRYAIVSGTDPEVFEFTVHSEFDIRHLTIHYNTMVKPGAPNLRLVTSVEYDGQEIYTAGRIIANCEMPSDGDLGDLSFDGTICDGWYLDACEQSMGWKPMEVVNTIRTVVVPAVVDEIADDAFANCERLERLYIREGTDINCLPGHVAWDCVKVPQSQSNDVFESEETWGVVTNGFFSGTEVRQPEFNFKKRDTECVRWLELKPREFQYICSLAFDMPRKQCEEVGGRWLFTRSLKSGNLLLQLASAFMEGREVEQDLQMALRCCEQTCWCAVGDRIPFAPGESFPGVKVGAVDQLPNPEIYGEWIDLFERANRLKDVVLTHFQRIDICRFERRGTGNDIMYFIPAHAFEGRDDLRDVLLPDELCDKHVRIGRESFARCTNLRSISVAGMSGSFALSRHANSFEGCDSLSDRMQYSADGSKLLFCLNAPEQCVICDHVSSIANFAFIHSRRLFNFRWGQDESGAADCVESEDWNSPLKCWEEPRTIGIRAFEGCNELTWVCTKGLDISLGARAFADCRRLVQYTFGVELYHVAAFLDISAQGVFEGCENMESVSPLWTEQGHGSSLVVNERSLGAQFARCRRLIGCPPIIATRIPPSMFESCNWLIGIKCVVARPDIIKAMVAGKRPAANLAGDDFSISTRAFANCHSLERFEFCRLRVSFFRSFDTTVELIDDNSRRVLFEHDAFLDCGRLRRGGSSFASALQDSDPSAKLTE